MWHILALPDAQRDRVFKRDDRLGFASGSVTHEAIEIFGVLHIVVGIVGLADNR